MPENTIDKSLPILDRPAALERLGGDEDMLEEFLNLLLEQSDGDLPSMSQAIDAGRADDVEHIAHSLKGAAASLSAERVREVAFNLEKMGRAGDLSQAAVLLSQLEEEISALRRSLGA